MSSIHARMISANAARWARMKIDPARRATIEARARVLVRNKARFLEVENKLISMGKYVPWWFVAIVAEREYGGPPIWNKQLGQGDPLDRVSHNVPAGRGPFKGPDAWLRCALDALIDCAPHAARWTDWSPGGALTILEDYNGDWYAMRGVPSAYVWSGSDQYVSGKFIADHVYRAGVKDVQEGCAPLLRCMLNIDSSIKFGKPGIKTTPKTMATSKTGVAAVTVGTAAAGEVVNQVSTVATTGSTPGEILNHVSDTLTTAHTAKDAAKDLGLFELLSKVMYDARFWLAVVVVGCAVFIWWDRRRRLQQENK